MSIEDSILSLAHAIGRLADAIDKQSVAPEATKPATTKPAATKPKAEPTVGFPAATTSEVAAAAPTKPELPIATASEVVAAAAATAAPAAAAPTYDTTRALMLQVSEKFGRDTVIGLLAQCGLQDLKKGTAAQFVAVTAAATAQLAGV